MIRLENVTKVYEGGTIAAKAVRYLLDGMFDDDNLRHYLPTGN